ncbi:DUF2165 family protein [Chachezhania sediminis]|uniref:DUF2165 family protein n=1 Tax=Chachezhania sediminis TaxID=2599291 RepID=UPI00131DE5A5|nr:DUF2165 family protein [Chachezhania sediminis]
MPDFMILLAQCFAVSVLAAWMVVGVLGNLRHPSINGELVDDVLTMTSLQSGFPSAYERLKHRRIDNAGLRRLVYRAAITLECAAAIGLTLGAILLFLAMLGLAGPVAARSVAVVGAILFSSVWAGFVIIGDYFCYWCGHESAQNTHFQLLMCGLGTILFLCVA